MFGRNKIVGQYTFTATFSKIGSYVRLGVSDTQNKNGAINKNYIFYQNIGYCVVGGDVVSSKGSGF